MENVNELLEVANDFYNKFIKAKNLGYTEKYNDEVEKYIEKIKAK